MNVTGDKKKHVFRDDNENWNVLTCVVNYKSDEGNPPTKDETVEGFFMTNKIIQEPFLKAAGLFKNLTHAVLDECGIESLKGLERLKHLIYLKADSNLITTIDNASIPTKLKFLFLRANKIDLIESEAMQKLLKCATVDLRNNAKINYSYGNLVNADEFENHMKACTGPQEDNTVIGRLERMEKLMKDIYALLQNKE